MPALAQSPNRVYRLGHLGNSLPSEASARQITLPELAKLGFVEGRNLVFDPHRLTESPAEFFVYEVYRDPAAFEAHITAEHGAVFNAALGELIVGDGSRLTWLTPLDGSR